MVMIIIGADGVEYVHTNVSIPRNLRDLAKKRGVSMSKELRIALEEKMREGDARTKQLPTNEAPASLPTADERRGI